LQRWIASLALATVAVAPSVFAAPAARLVYLRGKGAESCPDENAIKQAVEARLGYDPFIPNATAVMIAEITREAGAYKARIKLVDENNIVRGTRELTHNGDKCADMIDTMALTMSIAIDPDSLTGPKPKPIAKEEDAKKPEPAATTPEPSPPAPTARDEPAPPPKPPPSSPTLPSDRLAIDVGGGPLGFLGAGPAANVGAAAFARARWRRASIALEGRFDVPARRDLAGASVETAIAWGTVAPCGHASWAFACALLSVGSIRAASFGIREPRTDSALHAATGVRLGVELPVGAALRVFANATGLVTVTPQVIQLDGRDAYELPRLSAGLSAGVVVSIF